MKKRVCLLFFVFVFIFESITTISAQSEFVRGDANMDKNPDITDVIFILNYLFQEGKSPPCLDAADVNDDAIIDISDALKLLFVLFQGDVMPKPYPDIGLDTTNDALNCEVGWDMKGTAKDKTRYNEKMVFLVSDKDWHNILPLVPLTTWSGNEEWCKRGYGTPENVCNYPILIYHKENTGFDADSIIYFMQQYSPSKVVLAEEIPKDLGNLLIASPEIGAGLTSSQISLIKDYSSYWVNYESIVYVEDNYELALLASTYASLINSPLIIKGHEPPSLILEGKNIICVGNTGGNCNEQYSLEQLQKKYFEKTNTDKIVLTNPNDLNIAIEESFYPEKSRGLLKSIYSRNSLVAPFLASAKHELLLTVSSSDYSVVDSFIENKINTLKMKTNYLTIIASPNAIPDAYLFTQINPPDSDYYSLDASFYSEINDGDDLFDIAVGRIYGITISDVSSNIARNLFYEDVLKNEDKVLVTMGEPMIDAPVEIYTIGKVFDVIGYDTTATPDKTVIDNWKDKFLIYYNDHGSLTWAGISYKEIPYLDNSFVITQACLTCGFDQANDRSGEWDAPLGLLFCANILRKGGIGFIGAVDTAGMVPSQSILVEIFAEGNTIGKAFLNSKNALFARAALVPFKSAKYTNWAGEYILLGDPTLKLKTKYKMPNFQLNFKNEIEKTRTYELSVPAMKVEIPNTIKELSENPPQVPPFYYFTPTYNWNYYNYPVLLKLGLINDFEPRSNSQINIGKELTNEGNVFWGYLSSGINLDSASTYEFTEIKRSPFILESLGGLPDLIIEGVRLSENNLLLSIKNIGNNIAKGNAVIFISIVGCRDPENSNYECTFIGKNKFYYENTVIYDVLLYPLEFKETSINIPLNYKNIFDGKEYNFEDYSYYGIKVEILKDISLFQENYENDVINRIFGPYRDPYREITPEPEPEIKIPDLVLNRLSIAKDRFLNKYLMASFKNIGNLNAVGSVELDLELCGCVNEECLKDPCEGSYYYKTNKYANVNFGIEDSLPLLDLKITDTLQNIFDGKEYNFEDYRRYRVKLKIKPSFLEEESNNYVEKVIENV